MSNLKEIIPYYKLFISSLKEVKMCLISYKKGHQNEYVNERAFAYELYRQMANRLYNDMNDCYKWQNERPPIIINAELYKYVNPNRRADNKGRKFPDIVVHGGQDNTDKQLLVCEIKVKASEEEIKNDLEKLFDYMDYDKMFGHPYSMAVFINIGPIRTFRKHLFNIAFNIKRHGVLLLISYDKGKVRIINPILHKDD